VLAAKATSRIKLGVLALSPYEMHPLKIGHASASLNELANGRAVVGLARWPSPLLNEVRTIILISKISSE